ncbi:MAG TPA: translation initiation factor IF-2 N-terminal domain-containing protein, partial [Vicinamibacterales bacterium]|nr:translation initiation factor IF-2 N-terminal domain-containing protein [Vicinamibacterales bacterium]
MATVRVYKVAELLGTSSQEVLQLLKQNHGIELKSASSTLEEIVARQFVERLARQRGIDLPKGDIFSDAAVKAAKKTSGSAKKTSAPAEARPSAPVLPPPRLIKTIRPPAPPAPPPVAATESALVEEAPSEPLAPPEISTPPKAIPEPVEEPIVDAPAAKAPAPAEAETPASEPIPVAARPATPGRFVPPSIRLRIEEPGKAPPKAPPLQPRRTVIPQPAKPAPQPARPAAPPAAAARPAGPRPAYPAAARPSAGTTPAMIGGPRPLPSQPVRPTQQMRP